MTRRDTLAALLAWAALAAAGCGGGGGGSGAPVGTDAADARDAAGGADVADGAGGADAWPGDAAAADLAADGAVADAAAPDAPGARDAPEDAAGPDAAPDGGPDVLCPAGPNPAGNGCLLPCRDGWHEGADGGCHIDCPPGLAEDDAGVCARPLCPAGWHERSWSGTWNEVAYESDICVRDCPAPMVPVEEGGGPGCDLPCPEGAARRDGACERGCPAGMSPGAAAPECALDRVGAPTDCPAETWDPTFEGPSPLYVDVATTVAAGAQDGSREKPFATIGAAVAAAGDRATIHVARGEYRERVVVRDRSEVNLVGVCAAGVRVVGEGVGVVGGYWGGAVSFVDVDTARIRGVTVRSDLGGVLVVHDADGASATVERCVVEGAAGVGLAVHGELATIDVLDNTVSHATGEGIVVSGPYDGPATWTCQATLRGNRVQDLRPCVDAEWCGGEEPQIGGISVYGLSDPVVEGNELSDFAYASALYVQDAARAAIRGNLLHDLTGWTLIDVSGTSGGQVTVEDNVVLRGVAGEFAGYAPSGVYGVALWAGDGPLVAIVQRNVIAHIQGIGVVWADGRDAHLAVVDNQIDDVPWGIEALGGAGATAVTVRGNRLRRSHVFLAARVEAGALVVEENVFEAGERSGLELPVGWLRSALLDYDAQLDLWAERDGGSIALHRNRLAGLIDPRSRWGYGVQLLMAGDAVVEDNVFERNRVHTLLGASGVARLAVRGNRFVGLDSGDGGTSVDRDGLSLSLGDAGAPTDTVVEGNSFEHFAGGSALRFLYLAGGGTHRVLGNRFVRAGVVGFESVDGGSPVALEYTGNEHFWTDLLLDRVADAAIVDGRFLLCANLVHDQPEGAALLLRGVVNVGTTWLLARCRGETTIEANEFGESDGSSLMLVSTGGSTTVRRNLFHATRSVVVPGVGALGDGVHVSGTAEEPSRGVLLRHNRVAGSERLGILVSGADAVVEGNQYDGSGATCGGPCDLVIQREPTPGAVTGADTGFAHRPAEAFGAYTLEQLPWL